MNQDGSIHDQAVETGMAEVAGQNMGNNGADGVPVVVPMTSVQGRQN
jgi:hypothetical protein